tara:strand:+ start:2981 stop:3250 length:270 start_codon:yes stop_codon:yes gene_type:complete
LQYILKEYHIIYYILLLLLSFKNLCPIKGEFTKPLKETAIETYFGKVVIVGEPFLKSAIVKDWSEKPADSFKCFGPRSHLKNFKKQFNS